MFIYSNAVACSCLLLPLQDGFNDANAVFLGKATKPFEYDSERYMHWTIEVSEIWKGKVADVVELISDRPDKNPMLSYCMPEFPVGTLFMFFVDAGDHGSFKIIPCSWTSSTTDWESLLNRDKKDIAYWKKRGKGWKPKRNKNERSSNCISRADGCW